MRRRALAEPERAKAWLELAATAATQNPAGFFVTGLTGGEWPSTRREAATETSADARLRWVEETSWMLAADDAHAIVDDWRDLDDVERQELHEHVDRVRAIHVETEAAA
jgi:hypothetical protein